MGRRRRRQNTFGVPEAPGRVSPPQLSLSPSPGGPLKQGGCAVSAAQNLWGSGLWEKASPTKTQKAA